VGGSALRIGRFGIHRAVVAADARRIDGRLYNVRERKRCQEPLMWTTCPSAGADGRFLVGLSHGLLRSGGSLSSRAAGTPIFRRPMPCAPFAAVQERGSFYFAG